MLVLVNQFPGLGMTYSVKHCPPPATKTAPASLQAPADAGRGVRALSQLAQVEAGAYECADEVALRNICWLARAQQLFAHLSQHRQGFHLLSAAGISHDSSDVAHEEIDIERVHAWARATGAESIARFLNEVGEEGFEFLLVHGFSIPGGEA